MACHDCSTRHFTCPLNCHKRLLSSPLVQTLLGGILAVGAGILTELFREWTVLPPTPPLRKGVRAPQDGEYWFTAVTVDEGGHCNPADLTRGLRR